MPTVLRCLTFSHFFVRVKRFLIPFFFFSAVLGASRAGGSAAGGRLSLDAGGSSMRSRVEPPGVFGATLRAREARRCVGVVVFTCTTE